MALHVITASEVRDLLDVAGCIDVMAEAMAAVSRGDVHVPPRIIAAVPGANGYFALMPGSSKQTASYGAKVVSLHPGNPAKGLPAIQGFVTLFDFETGTPIAILDGAEITAIRTAAASGLATRLLARKECRSHGILGTGVQAEVHVSAIATACPTVRDVVVWGRDAAKAEKFCARHNGKSGLVFRPARAAEEAGACDIVSVVTGSAEPVLYGAWLRPGAHVNLVGAHNAATREADTATIQLGRIYVDWLEGAMREAGDILIPIKEGVLKADHIIGEIGALVLGRIDGRTDPQQITIYKSLGIVAQDLFAAKTVLDRARSRGVGQLVSF